MTPIFSFVSPLSLGERVQEKRKERGKGRKRAAMCEAIFCRPEAIFPFVSFVLRRRQQHEMAKRKRLKCKRRFFEATEQTPSPQNDTKNERIRSLPTTESDAKNPPHHEVFCCLEVKWEEGRRSVTFFSPSISICRPQPLPFIARRTNGRTVGEKRGEKCCGHRAGLNTTSQFCG